MLCVSRSFHRLCCSLSKCSGISGLGDGPVASESLDAGEELWRRERGSEGMVNQIGTAFWRVLS